MVVMFAVGVAVVAAELAALVAAAAAEEEDDEEDNNVESELNTELVLEAFAESPLLAPPFEAFF